MMIHKKLGSKVLLVAFLGVVVQVNSLAAQESRVLDPKNTVLSVNPFGLMLDLFNAEIERVISPTSTIGFGGSGYFPQETQADDRYCMDSGDLYCVNNYQYEETDLNYINADVFWRYYPSGTALTGWMFGVKTGITDFFEEGTYWGYGFDFNRSWLLGPEGKFYMGIGFGLKRLYKTGGSTSDNPWFEDRRYIPTIRIVNVGIAF